jgi:hypothetical protein
LPCNKARLESCRKCCDINAKPEMLYLEATTFESTRPQGAATLMETRQDNPSLVLP